MKSNIPKIRFNEFKSCWHNYKISELLIDVIRPIKMDNNQLYQLVTVKRKNAGIVSRGYFKGSDVLVKSQFLVKSGDFLISKRQIVHGANGIVPDILSNSIVSNEYLVLKGTSKLSVEFLAILSRLPIMYKMFYLSSYGVDIEKLVFNVSDWKKREIIIPSIEEQSKITNFFNQFDNYIFANQQELDILNQTKLGFIQRLFPRKNKDTPEIRFFESKEVWNQKQFKDVLQSYSYKPYLAGNCENGIYPIIQQGDNSIVGLAKGKPFEKYKDIVLFGDHTVSIYKPKKPFFVATDAVKILSINDFTGDFLKSLLERYKPKSQGYKRHFSILKKESFYYPTQSEEQVKIGEFFRQLDEVIELKEQEVELLKEMKKGFLQKMFV